MLHRNRGLSIFCICRLCVSETKYMGRVDLQEGFKSSPSDVISFLSVTWFGKYRRSYGETWSRSTVDVCCLQYQ